MGKIKELAVDAKDDIAGRITNELGMSIPEAMRGVLFSLLTVGFGDVVVGHQERAKGNKKGTLVGANHRKTEMTVTMRSPDGTEITLTKSQVDRAFTLDAAKDGRVREALEQMRSMFNSSEGVIDV